MREMEEDASVAAISTRVVQLIIFGFCRDRSLEIGASLIASHHRERDAFRASIPYGKYSTPLNTYSPHTAYPAPLNAPLTRITCTSVPSSILTRITPSSPVKHGSSSTASCESSMEAFMKWPGRASMRA